MMRERLFNLLGMGWSFKYQIISPDVIHITGMKKQCVWFFMLSNLYFQWNPKFVYLSSQVHFFVSSVASLTLCHARVFTCALRMHQKSKRDVVAVFWWKLLFPVVHRVEWSSAISDATNATLPAGITTYIITGLLPYVEYTVTVFAQNSAGESSGIVTTQLTNESSNDKNCFDEILVFFLWKCTCFPSFCYHYAI